MVIEGQVETCPDYFISLCDNLVIIHTKSKCIIVMALANLSQRLSWVDSGNNDKHLLLSQENEE